jgi:hypothetical protein
MPVTSTFITNLLVEKPDPDQRSAAGESTTNQKAELVSDK